MTGIPWESVTPGYWWVRYDPGEKEFPVEVGQDDNGRKCFWMIGAEGEFDVLCADEFAFIAPVAPRVSVDFHELA